MLMLVSFQCVLVSLRYPAPSFASPVPNQPVIVMTNIIYANVIRPEKHDSGARGGNLSLNTRALNIQLKY